MSTFFTSEPPTTKVAGFSTFNKRLAIIRSGLSLARRTCVTTYHTKVIREDCCYAAKYSLSLIKVFKVHEVLRSTSETLARRRDFSFSGKGFKSSRIKYLAPML